MVNNFKSHKKLCIQSLFIILLTLGCSSDDSPEINSVFSGDVFLNTQLALDNFASQGYTKVIGNIRIGANSGDITDITTLSLPTLTSIEGVLEISSTGLNTLNGLSALEEINGSFFLTKNTVLINLQGLENLTSLDGLSITENEELQSINQLARLTEISSIDISDNPKLISLIGLDNITQVKANLTINGNPFLGSLGGLQSLNTINGLLSIKNTNIESLSGLENLTSLSTGIIENNSLLTSLMGIDNLTSLTNSLSITANNFLRDFCAMETLLESDNLSGEVIIEDNAFNPTVEEILDEEDCSN